MQRGRKGSCESILLSTNTKTENKLVMHRISVDRMSDQCHWNIYGERMLSYIYQKIYMALCIDVRRETEGARVGMASVRALLVERSAKDVQMCWDTSSRPARTSQPLKLRLTHFPHRHV